MGHAKRRSKSSHSINLCNGPPLAQRPCPCPTSREFSRQFVLPPLMLCLLCSSFSSFVLFPSSSLLLSSSPHGNRLEAAATPPGGRRGVLQCDIRNGRISRLSLPPSPFALHLSLAVTAILPAQRRLFSLPPPSSRSAVVDVEAFENAHPSAQQEEGRRHHAHVPQTVHVPVVRTVVQRIRR